MRFDGSDDLRGAEFVNVDLSGARFANVNLQGASFKEAMLVGARLSGLIEGLVVNDIEVAPLIAAEMVRLYPERAKLLASDAGGVRAGWAVIEDRWAIDRVRALSLPEATLHERVNGEWSFLETLRHLVFVTDAWIGAKVLGQSDGFHPLGVPPSFITDTSSFGLDTAADPKLGEVLLAREARMGVVRDIVTGLTDAELARTCGDQTVLSCLLTVLDEEWHHSWYANRDLDALLDR